MPFKSRKVSEDVCLVVTAWAVVKEKKHSDYVSLHYFINIKDCTNYTEISN